MIAATVEVAANEAVTVAVTIVGQEAESPDTTTTTEKWFLQ